MFERSNEFIRNYYYLFKNGMCGFYFFVCMFWKIMMFGFSGMGRLGNIVFSFVIVMFYILSMEIFNFR